MPLYRFHCDACKKELSLFLTLKELNRPQTCPDCNNSSLTGPLRNENAGEKPGGNISCDLSRRS